MARDYIRVKRGMVFRYNIDPSVDKFDIPKISISATREIDDRLQYGWRDFIVVSNDISNATSPICSIVPVTCKTNKPVSPTHVQFTFDGKDLLALCEHVYTVNILELFQYRYTLDDTVMDKISDALAVQFNLKDRSDAQVRMSLDKVESIIKGIINQKVEEARSEMVAKATDVDIQDAVLRIGEGLESMLSQKPKATEKKDKPDVDPHTYIVHLSDEEKPIKRSTGKKRSNRRRWTLDSMQEFMDDVNRLSSQDMVSKYNFKNLSDFNSAKHYVKSRLDHLQSNSY